MEKQPTERRPPGGGRGKLTLAELLHPSRKAEAVAVDHRDDGLRDMATPGTPGSKFRRKAIPDEQAQVLALRFPPGREPVTERHLRQVLRSPVWAAQREVWRRIRPAPEAVVQ